MQRCGLGAGFVRISRRRLRVFREYFKYTKKKTGVGRRIFKMSPLHHHFQKAGNAGIDAIFQYPLKPLPESKITVRFWLVGIMLAVLTIITLKIR